MKFDPTTGLLVAQESFGLEEIKKISEYEPTKENVSKQVRESLNRVLGCVSAKNDGSYTAKINAAIEDIADQILEVCHGKKV